MATTTNVIGLGGMIVVLTGALIVPGTRVVLIQPTSVAAHADQDTSVAEYYTITYSLPTGLTGEVLERAILELVVDVRAKAREGYVNQAPVLELFALRRPFGGNLAKEELDVSLRVVRPIALGESRRVVLDVTKIIRAQLKGELSNNGLIVGSLTGMREGEFSFATGLLPGGAVGRLRLYETAASH